MQKINLFKTIPDTMKHFLSLGISLKDKLDPILVELIKIRSSQLNGCAYCLNLHTIDALNIGETNQRIFLLDAWSETDLFTEKEKLALELTEKLTLVSDYEIDEDLYHSLSKYFTTEDFAYLVAIIVQINAWNRFNIATKREIDKNYKGIK